MEFDIFRIKRGGRARKRRYIVMVERRFRILYKLMKKGPTRIPELAKMFGTTPKIIAKDIEYLEEIFGSILFRLDDDRICFLPYVPFDDRFFKMSKAHVNEKRIIAKYVFNRFIKYHDKIFISGSSTTLLLAMEIAISGMYELDVLLAGTYPLGILNKTIRLVTMIPGIVPEDRSSVRIADWYDFSKEKIEKSFLGFSGMSYDKGIYGSPNFVDRERKAVLNTKGLVVFMGDHTKFGKSSGKCYLTFEELERRKIKWVVVTDCNFESKEAEEKFYQEVRKFPSGSVVIAGKEDELEKTELQRAYSEAQRIVDPKFLFDDEIWIGIHNGTNLVLINGQELPSFRSREAEFTRLLLLAAARHVGPGWLHREDNLKCQAPGFQGISDLREALSYAQLRGVPADLRKFIIRAKGEKDNTVRLALRSEKIFIDESIYRFRSVHRSKLKNLLRKRPSKYTEKWLERLNHEADQLGRNLYLVERATELLNYKWQKSPEDVGLIQECIKIFRRYEESLPYDPSSLEEYLYILQSRRKD